MILDCATFHWQTPDHMQVGIKTSSTQLIYTGTPACPSVEPLTASLHSLLMHDFGGWGSKQGDGHQFKEAGGSAYSYLHQRGSCGLATHAHSNQDDPPTSLHPQISKRDEDAALMTFYRCTVESIHSMKLLTVWQGTGEARQTAQAISETHLPSLQDISTTRCLRKADDLIMTPVTLHCCSAPSSLMVGSREIASLNPEGACSHLAGAVIQSNLEARQVIETLSTHKL